MPCSYARQEYTAWPWYLSACATSGRCGWQGRWPGIYRCCIGIEMAGDLALGHHSDKRWGERTAGGLHIRTARVKGTATGDVKPVRDLTDNGESPGWRAARGRGRGHQGSSVRVPGLAADGFSVANLDEFAKVHDTNPITHMFNSGQVVADQQIGDTELGLQIFQEIENLRTDGDIE